MIEESPYKIYVDVNVEFTKEGKMIPRAIYWEDGTVYEIDKIIDVGREASLLAGSTGVKYTIYVEGFEKHLFYGDNQRWFVEANVESG